MVGYDEALSESGSLAQVRFGVGESQQGDAGRSSFGALILSDAPLQAEVFKRLDRPPS